MFVCIVSLSHPSSRDLVYQGCSVPVKIKRYKEGKRKNHICRVQRRRNINADIFTITIRFPKRRKELNYELYYQMLSLIIIARQ